VDRLSRYVLKTIWGRAMYWLATSRGDSEIDSHMTPREPQYARKMGEMYFDCFEKEAEKLWPIYSLTATSGSVAPRKAS
jgi:hypothetical protein